MRQVKTVKRNGTVSRKKVRAAVVAVSRISHLEEHILSYSTNKTFNGYFAENFYGSLVNIEFTGQKRATIKEISEALTTLVRDGCLEIVFLPWNGVRSADILLKLTPKGSERAAKKHETTK